MTKWDLEKKEGKDNFVENSLRDGKETSQMEQRSGNNLSEQSQQIADKFRARTEAAKREFVQNNPNARLGFSQKQDLHPRNVLKNSDETIFVIDNRIEIK